jgi:tetratricopeptide (TPR) repeat protein
VPTFHPQQQHTTNNENQNHFTGGVVVADSVQHLTTTGSESMVLGKELFDEGDYMNAALHYWRAVLLQANDPTQYTVEDAFQGFIGCYAIQDRTADGFLFIAKESMHRKQKEMAIQYVNQALAIEPDNKEAIFLKERFETGGAMGWEGSTNRMDTVKRKERENKFQPQWGTPEASNPLMGKSPEDLYEYGSTLFSRRNYEHCADVFELSCLRSGNTLGPSCSNAVYCRMMIMDWGFNGTGFHDDMARLQALVEHEKNNWRQGDNTTFKWNRATSVHPHMMLGYPLQSMLKRYVAESVAYMDEMMARVSPTSHSVEPLPDDLPFNPYGDLDKYRMESTDRDFKIKVSMLFCVIVQLWVLLSVRPSFFIVQFRSMFASCYLCPHLCLSLMYFCIFHHGIVCSSLSMGWDFPRMQVGFVGSGFNSKAVLYLSQDIFRFYDRTKFEIHIFSLGPPDNDNFISIGMRGVDWRKRVAGHVDYFHDNQEIKMDHIGLARYIHDQGIHVLIEWDGYARQGERAQGLLALRPAPVQILHQEYLGTSGAQ